MDRLYYEQIKPLLLKLAASACFMARQDTAHVTAFTLWMYEELDTAFKDGVPMKVK